MRRSPVNGIRDGDRGDDRCLEALGQQRTQLRHAGEQHRVATGDREREPLPAERQRLMLGEPRGVGRRPETEHGRLLGCVQPQHREAQALVDARDLTGGDHLELVAPGSLQHRAGDNAHRPLLVAELVGVAAVEQGQRPAHHDRPAHQQEHARRQGPLHDEEAVPGARVSFGG